MVPPFGDYLAISRSCLTAGVHEAARIAGLGEAGEILASQETISAMPSRFAVSEPQLVRLKGLSEPLRIVKIQWR